MRYDPANIGARPPQRVVFSADAHRLYFTVTQAESDIWMVALRTTPISDR
jgi:hypothetical protein